MNRKAVPVLDGGFNQQSALKEDLLRGNWGRMIPVAVGISVGLAFGGMSSQKIQHRVLDVLSSSSIGSGELKVSISISRWSFLCPRAHGSADFCTGGG